MIALVGFGALVILATLTMTDALLRTLGWARIPGFEDVSQVVLTVLIASGLPIALYQNRHIRVDLLGRALPKRVHRSLDLFAALVVLGVFAVVTYQLVTMTWDLQQNHRVTSTLQLPVAPGWWLTAGLVALTLPAQLAVIVGIWTRRDRD